MNRFALAILMTLAFTARAPLCQAQTGEFVPAAAGTGGTDLGSTGGVLASVAGLLNRYVSSFVTCDTCPATQVCSTVSADVSSMLLSAIGVSDADLTALGNFSRTASTQFCSQAQSPRGSSGGWGFSVGASAGAVAYVGATLEATLINGELRYFCSMGEGVSTEVGVSVTLGSPFRTLGCRNSDSYSGGFLTMNAALGVADVASFGLGLGLGVDNLEALGRDLHTELTGPDFSVGALLTEIATLDASVFEGAPSARQLGLLLGRNVPALLLASVDGVFSSGQRADLRTAARATVENVEELLRSLSGSFKGTIAAMLPALRTRAPNLARLLARLESHMSGCDAVGPNLGVGVGGSALSVGSVALGAANYAPVGAGVSADEAIRTLCSPEGDPITRLLRVRAEGFTAESCSRYLPGTGGALVRQAALALSMLNTLDQCRGRTLLRPVNRFARALAGAAAGP